MGPSPTEPQQWAQLNALLTWMVLFAGLAVAAALAFLLGHSQVRSLAESGDAPSWVSLARWPLYAVALAGLLLALFALGQGLSSAAPVLQQLWPRFLA